MLPMVSGFEAAGVMRGLCVHTVDSYESDIDQTVSLLTGGLHMQMMNIADTIIMFVGFYFLVSTAMMKVHGKVNRMLTSKKYDPQKARDLPGFIASMYLPNIAIGIITMATGAAHYVVADILGHEQTGVYIYVAYVVVYVVYAFALARAQKKYLSPQ